MLFLTCWSYYKVVCTDPGSPSRSIPSTGQDPFESTSLNNNTRYVQEDGPPPLIPLYNLDEQERYPNPLTSSSSQSHSSQEELVAGPSSRFIETKSNGLKRYCQKCQLYKPDRTHHCSICNQCILKMDHHCPWVNNCVGFNNYKFFLLFIGYTCLQSWVVFFTLLPYIIDVFSSIEVFVIHTLTIVVGFI